MTNKREQGTCCHWGRSFGFLRDAEGAEVFVHERSLLMTGWRALHVGDQVLFRRSLDSVGRTCAVDVELVNNETEVA
ncbi:MAG TPA: cold shock domain-containing protein [Vicinamibacterales bacterium]|nr:cold shock domain-containing protein [Vicinamibacterales bacterium]